MLVFKRRNIKCHFICVGDRGQGLVEYALILFLIAVVVFLAVLGFGSHLNDTYEVINKNVSNAVK